MKFFSSGSSCHPSKYQCLCRNVVRMKLMRVKYVRFNALSCICLASFHALKYNVPAADAGVYEKSAVSGAKEDAPPLMRHFRDCASVASWKSNQTASRSKKEQAVSQPARVKSRALRTFQKTRVACDAACSAESSTIGTRRGDLSLEAFEAESPSVNCPSQQEKSIKCHL